MDFMNKQGTMSSTTARSVEMDLGLRKYMMQVYNYMVSALLLTGVIAYFASSSEAFLSMMLTQGANGGYSPTLLAYGIMFAPVIMALFLGSAMFRMSQTAAQAWFWAFAAVMGLSLYYVFAFYTGASVVRVFFITAGMFGGMSLYGYTTKRDLTAFGSMITMAVLGLFIAFLVNMFLQSTLLHYICSGVGVILFTGMAAYNTQNLKSIYYQYSGNAEVLGKSALLGALSLYINFINLFVMLLQLFGDRR